MKTQWYDAWIQTNALRERTSTLKVPRELDCIHDYLNAVSPAFQSELTYTTYLIV